MSEMPFAFEKLGFMGLNPSSPWIPAPPAAEGCKPGRRVQTGQKGANRAEGCKPGRRVQTWQKGAKGAKSGYPPCTFAPLIAAEGKQRGVRPRCLDPGR